MTQSDRPVRSITTGPRGYEGEGFPVVRAFAGVSAAELDPFVHMDQMGEIEYQPGEPRGTDWHPHRGFETVTYMIDGRFAHQDSHGGGGLITDGATQWMTAGAGILHIETPPAELVDSGGLFHGIQLWVNLPRKDKFATPSYQAIEGGDVKLLSSEDGGALVRIIAGDVETQEEPGTGPARRIRRSAWCTAPSSPARSLNLPWNPDFNALVYVLSGRGTVGPAAQPIEQGQLAVLGAGDRITVSAAAQQDSHRPAMEVLILGGQPIREPVFHYGPFVMNSKSEVVKALEDFNAGRFGTIPPNALRPHTSDLCTRSRAHLDSVRRNLQGRHGFGIQQLELAEAGRDGDERERRRHRQRAPVGFGPQRQHEVVADRPTVVDGFGATQPLAHRGSMRLEHLAAPGGRPSAVAARRRRSVRRRPGVAPRGWPHGSPERGGPSTRRSPKGIAARRHRAFSTPSARRGRAR